MTIAAATAPNASKITMDCKFREHHFKALYFLESKGNLVEVLEPAKIYPAPLNEFSESFKSLTLASLKSSKNTNPAMNQAKSQLSVAVPKLLYY
jgi:hypothetical protein